MVIKIENYEGTLETFTFPYNSRSIDYNAESNINIVDYPFSNNVIITANGTIKPQPIILNGHFSGTDRFVNYRKLSKHFGENNILKKLFFESDKFSLGIGLIIQRTHTNERVNFVDYIFNFQPITSILLGNTQKTSGTNEGNGITPILEITGIIANGSNNVTISDKLGNTFLLNNSVFNTGNNFKYSFLKFVGTGGDQIKTTEFGVAEIDSGSGFEIKRVSSVNGMISLRPDDNITDLDIDNLNSLEIKFRNGWIN